jgi:hypothetical protein
MLVFCLRHDHFDDRVDSIPDLPTHPVDGLLSSPIPLELPVKRATLPAKRLTFVMLSEQHLPSLKVTGLTSWYCII